MKVLILGAPRTGTASTGQALEKLGYNVQKGIGHNFTRKNHLPDFTRAIRAKSRSQGRPYTKEDYDRFIGCYDAAHGLGVAALADELLEAYPEAKVVLTARDADSWIKSWQLSVLHFHSRWQKWRWIWLLAGGVERDFQIFRETAVPCWSYGHPFDAEEQRRFYVDYNQHIRDVVPKDRLLEFPPAEGWKPLCEFLGQPVPPKEVPFPHATARNALGEEMSAMWRRALTRALARIMSTLGLSAIAIILLLWLRRQKIQAMSTMSKKLFIAQRLPSLGLLSRQKV